MNLSSTGIITDKRFRLKLLRVARNATKPGGPTLECSMRYAGDDIDFCDLVGIANIKAHLGIMIDHEINELVREIEAHGVVVDE